MTRKPERKGRPELRGRAARLAHLLPTGRAQAARTPFVLLVVLLLGGGLIGLLVLNSALSEGAFRLDKRKRQFLLRFEIQQRRAFRTESSALVDRRQPSCLSALDTVYRQLFRIIKNDIRRKILVICAQTIYDPSAQ